LTDKWINREMGRVSDRQTDRQMNRLINGKIERQTNQQTFGKWTERHKVGGHTYRYKGINME
jgi:hypothetical protein